MQDFAGGGAERMMLNLAGGILRNGARVDLVVVRNSGSYADRVPADARLVELPVDRVVYSIPSLTRYLVAERPKAMLSTLAHVNTAAVLAGSLAAGRTKVVLREAINVTAARSVRRSVTGHVAFRMIPWVYRRADELIGVSQGVAEDLAQVCGLPPGRVHSIPNPVVTPDLIKLAAAELPHPWLAPGEPPVIVGVGRLTEQKDFSTLIRAVAHVRRKRPVRLVILGEGEQRRPLESLVSALGLSDSVLLPGFVINPFVWMSHATVFVLSSKFEGSPNSLVEAMACGTAVVSTDCPSGPREILGEGAFGDLVEVGDWRAMGIAILRNVQAGRPPMTTLSRALEFDADRVAQEYLKILLSGGDTRAPTC